MLYLERGQSILERWGMKTCDGIEIGGERLVQGGGGDGGPAVVWWQPHEELGRRRGWKGGCLRRQ